MAGRVYLYSNLMLNMVAWAAQHTFGRMWGARRHHPLGWSPEASFHVMLLKVLFTCGTYVHWRNFMAVAERLMGKKQRQGLVLKRVDPGTFGVPGCRSSWWLSLDPAESQEGLPPVKASCVLLYLHGGAFMAGAPRMYCLAYKLWMRQLRAQGISMRILAVGYPLCPEHPFPAPVKAAAAAYRWLLDQLKAEGRKDTVILGGDSAGGNLVVACLAYLRDGTLGSSSSSNNSAATTTAAAAASPPPLPAGALLISPAIDFTASSVFGPKLAEYFHQQPTQQHQQQQQPGAGQGGGDGSAAPAGFDGQWDYIDADEGSAVAQHYVQAASMADMCNPYVSPMVLPSFKGLVQQKMAVVWGGVEVLGPDCARFASRMQADGVNVETHVEKNQPHVYCVLPPKELLEKGAAVIVPFFASLCSV